MSSKKRKTVNQIYESLKLMRAKDMQNPAQGRDALNKYELKKYCHSRLVFTRNDF